MKTLGKFFLAAFAAGGASYLYDSFVLYPSRDLSNFVWPNPAYHTIKLLGEMAPRFRIVLTNLLIGVVIAVVVYAFSRLLPFARMRSGVRAGAILAAVYALYVLTAFDAFSIGVSTTAFVTATYEGLRIIAAAVVAGLIINKL
jgi:hypothetical protein